MIQITVFRTLEKETTKGSPKKNIAVVHRIINTVRRIWSKKNSNTSTPPFEIAWDIFFKVLKGIVFSARSSSEAFPFRLVMYQRMILQNPKQ